MTAAVSQMLLARRAVVPDADWTCDQQQPDGGMKISPSPTPRTNGTLGKNGSQQGKNGTDISTYSAISAGLAHIAIASSVQLALVLGKIALSEMVLLSAADPFLASRSMLPALIALTMFAIGSMLPHEEVNMVFRRWPLVLAGTALQYLAMPLLAFSVGQLWRMEGDALVGLMIVGCVPGAMASNVLTLNARGNTSYSVGLTTVATLLSPLVVPLALGFTLVGAEALSSETLWRTSGMLLLTVVLPVTVGHLLVRVFPKIQARARQAGSVACQPGHPLDHCGGRWLNRERLSAMHASLITALLTLNGLGYLAGYLGGWSLKLPESMRRALTLEVGMPKCWLGCDIGNAVVSQSRRHRHRARIVHLRLHAYRDAVGPAVEKDNERSKKPQ